MIALSYRREDSLAVAGRLYDRLQARFGKEKVFMDFDSIRPGFDFRDQIKLTIERCDVVIAIIGPKWLGERSGDARRIDDPNDFVRLEIGYALRRDIPIVPVLINDTPMPSPLTLPEDIRALVFRHALPLDSGLDFHQHADRLISGISDALGAPSVPRGEAEGGTPATPGRPPAYSRKKLLIGVAVTLFAVMALAAWILGTRSGEERPKTTSGPNEVERSSAVQAKPEATPATSVLPAAKPVAGATLASEDEMPSRKPLVEVSTVPSGAEVLQDGVVLGTTPLRRDDLAPGVTTFLLLRDGYLPRELKATIDPNKGFKDHVALARPAPLYAGATRVRDDRTAAPRPIMIVVNSDLRSGIMTQSGRRGDFVVKFTGVWEGTALHSVTSDVVSQPPGIQWTPESFVLQFSDDGKAASYECMADGKTYIADLSAQSKPTVQTAPVYKGTIRQDADSSGSGVPLTITFAPDRKSGTQTQSSKFGDTVVKFNGVWDGATLRAVTGEVVSKPNSIQWKAESFTLRFANDWKTASYECNADGHRFTAVLSVP
jgi:hypothetical protein